MKKHIENTRRNLGELGAMSRQTEAMERKIKEIAETKLAGIEKEIGKARTDALTGGKQAEDRYTGMIEERGRLNQVIARARAALGHS